MTKLPLDIAREALLSAQSELRDYHYDHPVHKQIREALAALSQTVADEREAFADAYQRLITGQIGTEGFWKLAQQAACATIHPAIKESLTTAQAVEPVGEVVLFGGDMKEVSWRKGKMPEAGTKLYTDPVPQASGQQEAAPNDREKALKEAEKACELIALKWQSKESTRASGAKAGAFECLDAIRALLKSQK